MAQLAPLLRHPQHDQQPAPVPAHRPAEPVDPPRAVAQQGRRGVRQPHLRPSPYPLTLQPPLARAAHDRLPRGRGREPEPVQRTDQRLLPRPVGTRQQELAEDREQRRAGGGRADGTASQDVFHSVEPSRPGAPWRVRALGRLHHPPIVDLIRTVGSHRQSIEGAPTILARHEAPGARRGLLLGGADVVGARGSLDDADPARGVPRHEPVRHVPVAARDRSHAALGAVGAARGGGDLRARRATPSGPSASSTS